MLAKASINAPPNSLFCVIGNNGFMFGRAFGHSHSALTSWQRMLNPAQNPYSTVIFISVIFLLSPSLMTVPVSSFCLQSGRVPEWTGGVIDYWQLGDQIPNYYSRVCWLAGLGSALSLSMLTESFFLLSVNIKMQSCSPYFHAEPWRFEFRGWLQMKCVLLGLMLNTFHTSELRAVQLLLELITLNRN